VSDGARLGLTEQREARLPQPRSVDQMIKALNKARRNNTLYIKLLGSDAGAVVNGELLSSLPPSVLGVLEGDRNGGNFNPLHSATIGEWELVYETSAPFLWSMIAAPDGSLFVGTGNEGKVFRIDAQGKGSLFFDSTELEAHALALAPNGGLYVGTSPDGRIYKVDRGGTATTFVHSH